VSDVSHELRAPITNLSMYLYLLESGHLEKRDQYVRVLREQTARLVQLVEDILDLSRLVSGAADTGVEPLELNMLVERVVTGYQARAEAANLALIFDPAAHLPNVLGDASQLSRVVTNLIGNAINYTVEGWVRVTTWLDERREQLCVQVADSGRGIEPDDLAALFDRFYRGRSAVQAGIPGTGLGLAIAKEIVDHHGGRIEVESQVGRGSTFRIWLPLPQVVR
jgi:signal transduction histidine kinase